MSIRKQYDTDLESLKNSLTEMGRNSADAVENALEALCVADADAAAAIVKGDARINNMERDIEHRCMTLLLRQQPVAGDLRRISTAMKVVTDIERIGDHAADIAEIIPHLVTVRKEGDPAVSQAIAMGKKAHQMILDALAALTAEDENAARRVIAADDEVDYDFNAIKHQLAQEIAARRFAPVYLLMGEESYFIDAIAERLATTVLGEAERAFNQITVYGKDSEAGQVINLCRQMPMMGSYQVVILKEAQQLRGLDKLSLYTQKPSPTTILVICHKEKNADKRSAFYKGCAANGAVLESVRPRDYEIASWLQQFIAKKGLAIDAKALSMLTDHLGTDISKISNELGKLVVSLPEGTKRITDADIEANIGISKDFNNFELCKAVVTRDMARALMIAEHFARNPKDNPLLLTVMALFGQFKELFVVNYLRWLARHKGRPFPPDTELMRILRKNNTFVIGEIKQNAAGWDNRKVFNILGLLREYDAKSKGLGAGGASDGELLRELLLKIFLL